MEVEQERELAVVGSLEGEEEAGRNVGMREEGDVLGGGGVHDGRKKAEWIMLVCNK